MLVVYLLIALVLTGAVVGSCQWAHFRFPGYRIADSNGARIAGRLLNLAFNLAIVAGMFTVALTQFGEHLIREGSSYWYEPIVFLLVFDLAYYCLHRTLHRPVLMRLLHGVHHRIRHPTAMESLYSHPVDTVIAFTLLFACMALVGPLGETSFVVASLLYMVIFGLGHANLDLPFRGMAPLNHWARRHDAHHAQRNVNFGSITPVWDWMFGTLPEPARRS
ncbi:MAG: sterol desaturase family protein [Gammaproteobacteria bacterium]|nr:sterol desaturase family protein [Gammaproteobacteria bacterium]MDE0366896.1 sterol desaturase family protein [Gammaproteobacteria bacterium]